MDLENQLKSIDELLKNVDELSLRVDPESNPYKSKYEAIDELLKLEESIDTRLIDCENLSFSKDLKERLLYVLCRLGKLYYETEEPSNSESKLKKALKISDILSSLLVTTTLIDINNHMCMIYFQREEMEKAKDYLLKAEELYIDFKSSKTTNLIDSSSSSDSFDLSLENLHTMTSFYLAQVYGSLDETALSAKYCQLTLKRQFESNNYEPFEFASFCLQISPYYQSECRWNQSIYCISAAWTILKKIKDDEKRLQLEADLSLFMGKFYYEYLENQYENPQQNNYRQDQQQQQNNQTQSKWTNSPEGSDVDPQSSNEAVLTFKGLVIDSDFPAPTLVRITNCQEAQIWVQKASIWFEKALKYYIIDGYTTEHVSICMEYASLLNLSSCFDQTSRSTKKQILDKRAAILEPLLKQLSPVHFFQLTQQLLFTCGEIYENKADLTSLPENQGILPSSSTQKSPPASKVLKFNKVLISAINYFQKFLDSIMDNGKLPNTLEPGVIESFFRAHFSLAKLHQRFRTDNKEVLSTMIRKSASYYKLIEALAAAYRPKVLQQEISMCKEMFNLLTLKANAISPNCT